MTGWLACYTKYKQMEMLQKLRSTRSTPYVHQSKPHPISTKIDQMPLVSNHDNINYWLSSLNKCRIFCSILLELNNKKPVSFQTLLFRSFTNAQYLETYKNSNYHQFISAADDLS